MTKLENPLLLLIGCSYARAARGEKGCVTVGMKWFQFDWTFSGHLEAQWIRKSIKKSDLFRKMMAMPKGQKKD